ncbi:MAG: DUF5118 domain-containing protein [Planctomycetaceae bacterium]
MLALLVVGACAPKAPTATPSPQPASNQNAAAPAGDQAAEPGARQGGGRGGAVSEPDPKPYDRVVTAEAETRDGLFKVHRIGPKLLFEIPRTQLGKDMLLVTEIARTVLGSGYGGQAVSNGVYRWERRGDRVDLRSVSYEAMAGRGRGQPVRQAGPGPAAGSQTVRHPGGGARGPQGSRC